MNLPKKLFILLVSLIFIAWGVGFGFLIGHSVGEMGGSGFWGEVNSCLSQDQVKDILDDNYSCDEEKSEYYSERFVFAGYSIEDEPLVGEISFVRNETFPGVFSHSYTGYLLYNGEVYEVAQYHNSATKSVEPEDGELVYTHIPAKDLSTREEFIIEWVFEKIAFKAETSQFAGDFIVENSPEYTKYVSAGKSELTFDGQKVMVDAMHTSIYSTDSSKYIFFDGYDELSLEAYQLVWWDDDHNFYLVDKSDVKSEHDGYVSHSWFLYKAQDGSTLKAFDLEGLSMVEISEAQHWEVELPFLSGSASLDSGTFIETRGKKGLITGRVDQLSDVITKSNAIGTFTYYDF